MVKTLRFHTPTTQNLNHLLTRGYSFYVDNCVFFPVSSFHSQNSTQPEPTLSPLHHLTTLPQFHIINLPHAHQCFLSVPPPKSLRLSILPTKSICPGWMRRFPWRAWRVCRRLWWRTLWAHRRRVPLACPSSHRETNDDLLCQSTCPKRWRYCLDKREERGRQLYEWG